MEELVDDAAATLWLAESLVRDLLAMTGAAAH